MTRFSHNPAVYTHSSPLTIPIFAFFPHTTQSFWSFSHRCMVLTGAVDTLGFVTFQTTLLNQNKSLPTFRDPLHWNKQWSIFLVWILVATALSVPLSAKETRGSSLSQHWSASASCATGHHEGEMKTSWFVSSQKKKGNQTQIIFPSLHKGFYKFIFSLWSLLFDFSWFVNL